MLNGWTEVDTEVHALLWDIRAMVRTFQIVKFIYIPWDRNRIAHELARVGFGQIRTFGFRITQIGCRLWFIVKNLCLYP